MTTRTKYLKAKKAPLHPASRLSSDEQDRIRWRGVRLAPRVYRAFCGVCGGRMEAVCESEARRLDLKCSGCSRGE